MADPEDGWPVPWQPVWGSEGGPLKWVEATLVRGFLGGAARVPDVIADRLIALAARAGRTLDRRHSDAAERFLVQALGELDPDEAAARVLTAYRHFFRVVLDTRRLARIPRERIGEHFTVHWTEEVRRVVDQGRGALLISGHIGNWEAGIAAVPTLGFAPLYGIAKAPKNLWLSKSLQREREAMGMRILPRRGAMEGAHRILGAGGALAMILDQRARGRPFLAPFFGRPARCDRTAGVLLRRHRAPAIVLSCLQGERPMTWEMEFHDVVWPEDVETLDTVDITARINGSFERMIRAHPDQYFWLHDRYKDTPLEFPVASARGTKT